MGTRRMRITTTLGGTAALAGVLAATALAVTPTKGVYTGASDQVKLADHAVKLRVNKNHKVVHFEIGWRAKCSKPGKFWTAGTQIDNPANESGGAFHDHGSYTSKTSSGFTGDVTITLNGHFTDKTHAQGSWKANVKVYNSNNKKVDTCSVSTHWHVGPQA
jgi:hypothetical protein